MKCKCNKCSNEFRMKVTELKFIPEGKVIIEGFECPHCHKEYITNVTDNALRKGIYDAKQLKDEIKEINRKKDREYAAYMEDIGKVPTQLCIKYAKQLEELQSKYRMLCRSNRIREEHLKAQYNANNPD